MCKGLKLKKVKKKDRFQNTSFRRKCAYFFTFVIVYLFQYHFRYFVNGHFGFKNCEFWLKTLKIYSYQRVNTHIQKRVCKYCNPTIKSFINSATKYKENKFILFFSLYRYSFGIEQHDQVVDKANNKGIHFSYTASSL